MPLVVVSTQVPCVRLTMHDTIPVPSPPTAAPAKRKRTSSSSAEEYPLFHDKQRQITEFSLDMATVTKPEASILDLKEGQIFNMPATGGQGPYRMFRGKTLANDHK